MLQPGDVFCLDGGGWTEGVVCVQGRIRLAVPVDVEGWVLATSDVLVGELA